MEINYAAFYSDYICAFVDGKVAKFGTVKEGLEQGKHCQRIYKVDFKNLEIEENPLSIYSIKISMEQLYKRSMNMHIFFCSCNCSSHGNELSAACSSSTLKFFSETAGSNQSSQPETVTIKSLNANGEEVDLVVPYNPQRIAILDMASLDILDALGVGDRVVGSANTSLD